MPAQRHPGISAIRTIIAATAFFGLHIDQQAAAHPKPTLDEKSAIRTSQAAIGKKVRDHRFVDTERQPVRLAKFLGKPLVVSLVYTSCDHTCPLLTQALARAVDVARNALGADSFHVVTIGFDTRVDTPERMRSYARAQGIDQPNWRFLSADAETIAALAKDLGFVFYPSPRGFDHLAQTTIVDENSVVYRQIYGLAFDPPVFVEPMKDLIFGRKGDLVSLSGIINRVRLFCTIYDPASDRYRFDYSVIIGAIIGAASLAGIAVVLIRAWQRSRPKRGEA